MIEIKTKQDLPEYGKYVLVYGIDEQVYGKKNFHVCSMDDLEDGQEFLENGNFYWLLECGRKIENVTHWMPLPERL